MNLRESISYRSLLKWQGPCLLCAAILLVAAVYFMTQGFDADILPGLFTGFQTTPSLFYITYAALMLASCFGLPLPEEVLHFSAGLFCYASMGRWDPHLWWLYVAGVSLFCVACVIIADFIVYGIGVYLSKTFFYEDKTTSSGPQLIRKVRAIALKYGVMAPALIRLVPGGRMPGYMTCGALRFDPIKFLIVDGLAVLATVSVQVALVANLGQGIVTGIKGLPVIVICLVVLFFLCSFIVIRRRRTWSI